MFFALACREGHECDEWVGEGGEECAPGESYVESPRVSEETDALLYVRSYGRYDDEVLLSALEEEREESNDMCERGVRGKKEIRYISM